MIEISPGLLRVVAMTELGGQLEICILSFHLSAEAPLQRSPWITS